MIVTVICDWCGRPFERDHAFLKGKKHHFCCRQCLADYSSKKKNPEGYQTLKDYTNIGCHFTEIKKDINLSGTVPIISVEEKKEESKED